MRRNGPAEDRTARQVTATKQDRDKRTTLDTPGLGQEALEHAREVDLLVGVGLHSIAQMLWCGQLTARQGAHGVDALASRIELHLRAVIVGEAAA